MTTLGHLRDIPLPSGATLMPVFTWCLLRGPVTGHPALWDTPRLGPLLPWSHAGTSLDILGSPLCPNTVAGTDTPSPHAVCTRWIKEENTDIYSGGAKYPPNPPQKVSPCVPILVPRHQPVLSPVPTMEVTSPAPSWAGWTPVPQFPHQSRGCHGMVGHRERWVGTSHCDHAIGTRTWPRAPGNTG